MNVKVDTSEIKNAYDTFNNESEDLSNNINNLLAEIEKVSSVWKGNDSESFVTSANEKLVTSLNKIKELVDLYSRDLKTVYQSYDALDDAFLNKNIEVL